MGQSGSGKSTLLHLLAGLDESDGGIVRVAGKRLDEMDDRALTEFRRTEIGVVFQQFNLIPTMTARENVELPGMLAGRPANELKARSNELLEQLGISERADHRPEALSGGEQQRVAIARAIAKRPDVLLCDEPTGALDSATGVQVLEALVEVNRDLGTATVLITHNAEIQRIAHRVVVLADGRIVRDAANPAPVAPSEVTW